MPLDGSEFKFEIDETTKLLIAARERIERGWCQKKIAIGGDVCAVGALTRTVSALADPSILGNAMRRLQRAVGLYAIPLWNDEPHRTKDDILAAYDRAIASV